MFSQTAKSKRSTFAGASLNLAMQVDQLKTVYESLMEFAASPMAEGRVDAERATLVLTLFKRHQQISSLLKVRR